MLLDVPLEDDTAIALSAALPYGTYIATNQLRHETGRPHPQDGFERIWDAIRKAGLQSRRLAAMLKKVWS